MNNCDKLRQNFFDKEAVYISSYPNIYYYSGFESADARLIITKDRQILFTDSRYTVMARLQAHDFEIYDIQTDFERVVNDLKPEVLYFEEDTLTVAAFDELKKLKVELKPFARYIKKPRRIKTTEEIKRIQASEALGDAAFSYILERIRPGRSEKEIAFDIEFFMKKNGASALSFETICASGVRSCMPHGVASDKLIEKGDFLTLDFGCILDGYCSDMTRTVVIGNPSQRQKEIYDLVLMAQKAALEILKPGIKCKDADNAARKIIEDAGYGKNFGHGTGHGVGIEIHELPSLSPKSDDILEPGNIVTVEPGIYIEDFGGVRIEDLVQITDQKSQNLTNSVKDLLII